MYLLGGLLANITAQNLCEATDVGQEQAGVGGYNALVVHVG